jgi:hypothetical protein
VQVAGQRRRVETPPDIQRLQPELQPAQGAGSGSFCRRWVTNSTKLVSPAYGVPARLTDLLVCALIVVDVSGRIPVSSDLVGLDGNFSHAPGPFRAQERGPRALLSLRYRHR